MSVWLHVGASPSVIQWLPFVRELLSGERYYTITCNSGIHICKPDYAIFVDYGACIYFAQIAREKQAEGTVLVTLDRGDLARRKRDIGHYDVFLRLPPGDSPKQGCYGRFRYSGPLCLEFACMHGAKEVHIVGMDGYRKRDDWYDMTKTPPSSGSDERYRKRTREVLAPAVNDIARAWPDVQFVQYGDPCYHVDSRNWTVVRDGKASPLPRPKEEASATTHEETTRP